MLKRRSILWAAATLAAAIFITLPGCQSGPATTPGPTTTTSPPTSSSQPTLTNQDFVEVVSVRGPLSPINPGGPNVEITLKNISDQPITSLSASIQLNRPYDFAFDVSPDKPLLPGSAISARQTLIGGGFDDTSFQLLVLKGTLKGGKLFSLNRQVQITP